MVIQMILRLGDAEESKIYRNVMPYQLGAYRVGFYGNQPYYTSGEMFSLRGKDKTLIGRFNNERQPNNLER